MSVQRQKERNSIRWAMRNTEVKSFQQIAKPWIDFIQLPIIIWSIHPKDQSLKIRAYKRIPPNRLKEFTSVLTRPGIIEKIISSEHQLIHINVKTGRMLKNARTASKRTDVLHITKVRVRSKTGGFIGIITEFGQDILSSTKGQLSHLSVLSGKIIENEYRKYENLILARVARKLRTTTDVKKLPSIIVESARKFTNAHSSTFFLMDKGTNTFVIGASSPEHANDPKELPRDHHGLTRRIIETGEPIIIHDTHTHPDVRTTVKKEGIRSLIGVRVQMRKEGFGVLYVNGTQKDQFTDDDKLLLQTMADQISAALGWSRVLLRHLKGVEKASSNIFKMEDAFQMMCKEIQKVLKLEYVSIQLIRPEEETIETVFGTGIAKEWTGISKHYLEKLKRLRDLQADIVQTKKTEIISGKDKRLDPWIYEGIQKKNIVRITTPIMLMRDDKGRLVPNWWTNWKWTKEKHRYYVEKTTKKMVQHTVISPNMTKKALSEKGGTKFQVIGTVGVGHQKELKGISVTKAMNLNKIVSKWAPKIYQTQLHYILETIVERARQIVRAHSATLHFLYDPNRDRYIYEVSSGDIPHSFLEKHPPRTGGIGRRAIADGKPKLIPDPFAQHPKSQLKKENKEIFDDKIKAIAAFPIVIDKTKEGVLYIHFHEYHRFTQDEIGWLQLFANHVKSAIRHTTNYRMTRDSAHQLSALHSIAHSLNRQSANTDLRKQLCYQALNLLAADVVILYKYIENKAEFNYPPKMAGRFKVTTAMKTEVRENDAPALLVDHQKNIFTNDPINHEILNNPDKIKGRNKRTFVQREGIESAAGVLLKAGNETVGVMFINFRRKHYFTDEEKKLIELLANTAGIAIKNERVVEKLNEIDQEILSTLDLDMLLRKIVDYAIQITPANRCEIRILDPISGNLRVESCYPFDRMSKCRNINIEDKKSIIAWAARKGKSRIVRDTQKDPLYIVCDPKARSELCVPLKESKNKIIGVINVENYKADAYTNSDLMNLEALASRVVIAFQNAERQKQMVASETIATLGDLSSDLGHRIKNEVGVIKVRARTIFDNCDNNSTLKNEADKILSASQKILSAAEKMRGWKLAGDPELVSIKDVITELLKEIKISSKINVNVKVSRYLPKINSRAVQMKILFHILIQNAIEAMSNGGNIQINVKKIKKYNYAWILCEITDNGKGIKKSDIPNIFKSYFTTKSREQHLGFGLWWAKNYIKRECGEISVESKYRKGTKFSIKLPVGDVDNCLLET